MADDRIEKGKMEKKEMCKVLCFYLPQFHETIENSQWWGEGYTEWTAVKNAKPYFKGHVQPKVPFNENYYDLSDPSAKTWEWQSKLARKCGIGGFVIYHYWFAGRKMLERPVEILLEHPEIDQDAYWDEWLSELGDKIEAVHMKDFVLVENGEYIPVCLGEGVIRYERIIRWLKKNKPDIVIVREELQMETAQQDLKYMRELWENTVM